MAEDDPVTVFQLAEYRLDRPIISTAGMSAAGLSPWGKCEVCLTTLDATEAYPATTGYWRCGEHLAGLGFTDLVEADRAVFGDDDEEEADP